MITSVTLVPVFVAGGLILAIGVAIVWFTRRR